MGMNFNKNGTINEKNNDLAQELQPEKEEPNLIQSIQHLRFSLD